MEFTNKREYVTAKVAKVWDDANDQDGKRPALLNVRLLANGDATQIVATLTARNGWEQEIQNLPKYDDDGEEIEYGWSEVDDLSAIGYSLSDTKVENIAEDDGTTVVGKTITLTNKHTPEVTKARVVKVWEDNNNANYMRPTSIVVKLLADGKPAVDKDGNAVRTVTLTADNGWTYTTGEILPKYANGKLRAVRPDRQGVGSDSADWREPGDDDAARAIELLASLGYDVSSLRAPD